MSIYRKLEFPDQGRFPMQVAATTAWHVSRRDPKSRKGYDWCEATFVREEHVMVVRMTGAQSVDIWSPTDPETSVRVRAGVAPSGLQVGLLWRPGCGPFVDLPDPPSSRPFRWALGDRWVGMSFATERSDPRKRHWRCMADGDWVSASLNDLEAMTSVRVTVYLDGRVWIGVPGVGQALQGFLGEGGLDFGLSDPAIPALWNNRGLS
jgi:hypothetical protein